MLLAVDIGNSSTKFGVFEGENLLSKFSIPTIRNANASQVSEAIAGRLSQTVGSAIVASVVPELDRVMRDCLQDEYEIKPLFVDHSFNFGLKVSYEPLTSLGIDRLVNASAAAAVCLEHSDESHDSDVSRIYSPALPMPNEHTLPFLSVDTVLTTTNRVPNFDTTSASRISSSTN